LDIRTMLAGTMKPSLSRLCSMTVPASAVEPQGFCGPAPAEDALVGFRHAAGDMLVRIWEQECTQE
jgi:hypothetical protein